ncbi:DUF4280 domain-containing protein [Hymenobacter terrenus]|uniref:DUF4280 domain-containing protein n=1 Tax=Hymenobacter terrenus TaxID=1629124 RepID=UPI000619B66D|nr:DUF4280 domain-containing protein [Hymenobacter terrenus]
MIKLSQYAYVCDGATLKCSQGSKPGKLRVLAKRPTVGGKPGSNITDNTPMANVTPFGVCKITNKACVMPSLAGWEEYFRNTRLGGAPALLECCTNRCGMGGEITVSRHGQTGMRESLEPKPIPARTPPTDAQQKLAQLALQRPTFQQLPIQQLAAQQLGAGPALQQGALQRPVLQQLVQAGQRMAEQKLVQLGQELLVSAVGQVLPVAGQLLETASSLGAGVAQVAASLQRQDNS